MKNHDWLSGRSITPPPVRAGMSVRELLDGTFQAFNAARLREACQLFALKMLRPEVTVGLALSGALTPAGIGRSCLVPMIQMGMIDWIVSTGANLYHDAHFALGLDLHAGRPFVDDRKLRSAQVVRIYDILFSYEVLLNTDRFFRQLVSGPEFQRTMGTAEFHHLAGKYLAAREQEIGREGSSILAAAYRAAVPVYTPSPGDSSIGMNVAAAAMEGTLCRFDPTVDVTETAAIVYGAARAGGSAVLILGGGSPKNFVLQTEPHIQEVLGLPSKGHTYFIQITDARPDTGGLSGATPSEAVSWGKVAADHLPDAVVCYMDTTVAMPLLCAYAMEVAGARPLKRLYERRQELVQSLREAARAVGRQETNPSGR